MVAMLIRKYERVEVRYWPAEKNKKAKKVRGSKN
jgi:hypothetical protein